MVRKRVFQATLTILSAPAPNAGTITRETEDGESTLLEMAFSSRKSVHQIPSIQR
jgi:hypothetical protein